VDNSGRKRRVLRTLVGISGKRESVHVSRIAESVECDPAAVREALDSLRSYEFVKTTGDGRYEPTVTGREFLALDVDEGSFVVVDTPDDADRAGPSHGKD
jgi:predicted transcriptional regulator